MFSIKSGVTLSNSLLVIHIAMCTSVLKSLIIAKVETRVDAQLTQPNKDYLQKIFISPK